MAIAIMRLRLIRETDGVDHGVFARGFELSMHWVNFFAYLRGDEPKRGLRSILNTHYSAARFPYNDNVAPHDNWK